MLSVKYLSKNVPRHLKGFKKMLFHSLLQVPHGEDLEAGMEGLDKGMLEKIVQRHSE